MLLIIVVDDVDALDSRILRGAVVLFRWGLVPIEDATDKGRDEESTCFSSGDSLRQREQKCKVAVNAVVFLQNLSGLYSLPGWGQLDQNSVLADANVFIELRKFHSAFWQNLSQVIDLLRWCEGPCWRMPWCQTKIGHQPRWRPSRGQSSISPFRIRQAIGPEWHQPYHRYLCPKLPISFC